LTIKKLIQNNTLGKIHTFESFFNRYRQPKAHWRESSQIGSGVLYDLGPHLIDQALELFGVPEKIFARLETQRKGAQNIDFFELHLIYLKNLTVRLQAGALFANYDQRFLIHGDLASVDKKFLDVQESQLKSGMKITDPNFGQDPENFKLTLADQTLKKIKSETGCYQQFYKEVFRAINGEKSHIPTLEQGLKTIQIIRLAMESTQDQKIIKVCL
jgi:scyllo-inositol 2-dehydrogenase (NADP+)